MDLDTLVVILAGGEGSRLWPLTAVRTKPAVPIGGKYRLIDIPLSNAFNSGLSNILVLAQGKDDSLIEHIKDTWPSMPKYSHAVKVTSPQGLGETYDGDADAVRQVQNLIERKNPKTVLIVPGDHLLKMDYSKFLNFMTDFDRDADAAISLTQRPIEQASQLGSMGLSPAHDGSRIIGFEEKNPDTKYRVPGKKDFFYASMGIYAFKTARLFEALENEGDLFGKHIIPKILSTMNVYGYRYIENNHLAERIRENQNGIMKEAEISNGDDSGYWRDVGTISEYFDAHMDLVSIKPAFNLYGKWEFYTYHPETGPSKASYISKDLNMMIGAGTIMHEVDGRNIVIATNAYIDHAKLDSVIAFNGADIQRSELKNTIVDKSTKIYNCKIGFDIEEDLARGIYVDPDSEIRVVPKWWNSEDPGTWTLKEEIKQRYLARKIQ